jgi:serine/threonine protein kinase
MQGDEEFKNEVDSLSKMRHPNIVRLYGYASAASEKCLVYALMENGSLEDQLSRGGVLDWKQRLHIAVGATRGLNFLHSQPGLNCVHRDIKSANILLDGKMQARIGDFGIVRMWHGVQERLVGVGKSDDERGVRPDDDGTNAATPSALPSSHVTTMHLKGTWGYIDPTYARSGRLSPKSDVFSMGVVLLEILTGRKAIDTNIDPHDLVSQVEDLLFEVSQVRGIIDPFCLESWPISNAMQFASLCSQCLEPRARHRVDVASMLVDLETVYADAFDGKSGRCVDGGGGGGGIADAVAADNVRNGDPIRSSGGPKLTNARADERAALWENMLIEQGQDLGLGRDCGFECPITSELMHDPSIADDGHTYERTAIESWFSTGNRTSPVTGKVLATQRLRPNHALRIAIEQRFGELRRMSLEVTRKEGGVAKAEREAEQFTGDEIEKQKEEESDTAEQRILSTLVVDSVHASDLSADKQCMPQRHYSGNSQDGGAAEVPVSG